jgi:hypothetical protein
MSDMENPMPGDTRVSVSLAQLRAELTSLELRLVDRLNGALLNKADRVIVEQHSQRLSDFGARLQNLENTVVKRDGPIVQKVEAIDQDITSLKTVAGYKKWLWAQTIALTGIALAVVGLLAQNGGL